jgi:hypothetical protein
MLTPRFPRPLQRRKAFALRDLLTLLAALAVIVFLQIPAVGNARGKSRVALCIANHQQLAQAWLLYAADNSGRLVLNPDGVNSGKQFDKPGWAGGWLDFSTGNSDNTNTLLLTKFLNRAGYYAGLLGPYLKSASVFRCPEDSSVAREGATFLPRSRSVSMNSYMNGVSMNPLSGGQTLNTWTSPVFKNFRTLGDFAHLPPAQAFVFTDERAESINDGAFNSNMVQNMNASGQITSSSLWIVDYPASWHDRGDVLSFADGHAEYWRWKDARTMPANVTSLNVPSPDNTDITRLALATTAR